MTTEIEMIDDGGMSDTSSDFDSRPSSPDGEGDGNLLNDAMENEITSQLIAAGVVGVAAAGMLKNYYVS
jgi:nuclear respiratory factor 1